MSNPFEYTWWQEKSKDWSAFWKWVFSYQIGAPWRASRSDVTLAGRPLDKAVVVASVEVEWPEELRDSKLRTGMSQALVNNWNLPGYPVQRCDPSRSEEFYMSNPYTMERGTRYLPRPINGWRWTEGMPAQDGAFDRHWLGVTDTGDMWEAIQLTYVPTPRIMQYGVFNKAGELIAGKPVCKGDRCMTNLMYDTDDEPHRLGMVLHDYGGGDGSKDWEFPRIGDWVRLSKQAYIRAQGQTTGVEALNYLTMLHVHGAVVFDRGGQEARGTITHVAGAQASRMVVPDLWMRDFEKVVA